MRPVILFIALLMLGLKTPVSVQSDLERISAIMKSEQFTISTQRLDFGLWDNTVQYKFERQGSVLKLNYKSLIFNDRDNALDNKEIRNGAIDSLILICRGMKLYEIDHPWKFARKVNRSGVTDIVSVFDNKDTITLIDVDHNAFLKILKIIRNNIE